MDPLFTRWDPVTRLETQEFQLLYLQGCTEENPGNGQLVWQALQDIARAPLTGSFTWSVRELIEHVRAGGRN